MDATTRTNIATLADMGFNVREIASRLKIAQGDVRRVTRAITAAERKSERTELTKLKRRIAAESEADRERKSIRNARLKLLKEGHSLEVVDANLPLI